MRTGAELAHVIAILEDDPGRVVEMRRCVALLGGSAECVFRDNAPDMIALLERRAAETALVSLISLDHDLGPNREIEGESIDPGTGRDVADWLAGNGPTSPVLVHSSNGFAARGMVFVLEEAGRRTDRIVPYCDLDWVEASWLPAVLNMLPDDDA